MRWSRPPRRTTNAIMRDDPDAPPSPDILYQK
jgi:phosphatidylethanolamine-binding protein (PEBP) family uncharacterized protein